MNNFGISNLVFCVKISNFKSYLLKMNSWMTQLKTLFWHKRSHILYYSINFFIDNTLKINLGMKKFEIGTVKNYPERFILQKFTE